METSPSTPLNGPLSHTTEADEQVAVSDCFPAVLGVVEVPLFLPGVPPASEAPFLPCAKAAPPTRTTTAAKANDFNNIEYRFMKFPSVVTGLTIPVIVHCKVVGGNPTKDRGNLFGITSVKFPLNGKSETGGENPHQEKVSGAKKVSGVRCRVSGSEKTKNRDEALPHPDLQKGIQFFRASV
jgi:hypothetical protein